MQTKGIIYIEYRNGMYLLPDNANKISEIQNSRLLHNGCDFIDLSACNSTEGIIDTVMETQLQTIVFGCEKETMVLIKDITRKLASRSDDMHFQWIVKGTGRSYSYDLDGKNVKICPDYSCILGKDTMDAPKITFAELMQCLPDQEELTHNNVYKEAMSNGFCLMLTGKYPNSFIYSKGKHVYVEDSEILDQTFLPDYMDLNSAIFIPSSTYNETKYCEWKTRYYNHIHVVDSDTIRLDGNQVAVPWKMIGYFEFQQEGYVNEVEKSAPYLTINSNQDICGFVEDINSFALTGKVRDFNFYLLHECKWANRCTLMYQMRFCLNVNGGVAPCGDQDHPAYHLQDEEYDQFSTRVKIIEKTQIMRKCKNCMAKGWCTKCSFLPEGLVEEQFCGLMTSYPVLPDFINIKNILLMLKRYSSLDKTLSLGELEFSNYSHTLLLPDSMPAKKPIDQNMYLFRLNEKNYYFNPMKGQILRVGIYLAFIIEAIQRGYTYDEIQDAYRKKWEDQPEGQNFQRAWRDVHDKILATLGGI